MKQEGYTLPGLMLGAFIGFAFAPSADAALALRLEAANYNAGSGTWTDSSGLNNHATQGTPENRPAWVAGQTLGNDSVVRFDGDDTLNLSSGISPTSGAEHHE